jgi:hypothetical protein
MVEPVGKYSKDTARESFLERLNAQLAPTHDAEYREVEERFPTLQIIGVPRSGTTLLSQLLSAHLDVGYIDHVVAAFWQAPLYGIRLSQQLLNGVRPTDFTSEYGRTAEVHDPHEFGYFWRDLLGHDDLSEVEAARAVIDWERVRHVITNMCDELERPVVFKSFLLTWHMLEFQAVLPRTCFVWVKRDPLDTAMSILRFREGFAGSRDLWVSMKPRTYGELSRQPRADQVAGQVYDIEQTIQANIGAAAPGTVLEVEYEQLCRQPAVVLEDCRVLLGRNGFEPDVVGIPPDGFRITTADSADPDYAAVGAAVVARYGRSS